MTSKNRFVSVVFIMFIVLAGAMSQAGHAQAGAADQFANPLPESGRWFANDGSRTGFFIEVQNGIVAGLYVGGDADGDNAWLSFSGELQPGATVDVEGVWILDTDLLRFSGTGCIVDCIDAAAGQSSFEDVGDIRIDFSGRSAGTVWIDDQPAREIAPIYFGVERTEINPVAPPVFLPEFEGKWVVAHASDDGLPDEYLGAGVIGIGERDTEVLPVLITPRPDTPELRYRNPIIDDPDDMFPPGSVIECTTFVDATLEPSCFISTEPEPMSGFWIDFDWASDSRLTVVRTSDGSSAIQFQLFRLNHD